MILCDMTACSFVDKYRRFGKTSCFHLLGKNVINRQHKTFVSMHHSPGRHNPKEKKRFQFLNDKLVKI